MVCLGGVIRGMIRLMPETWLQNQGTIRGYDSGHDSGYHSRPVVINSAILGNTLMCIEAQLLLIFRSVCRMFIEMNWVQTCSISTTPSVHTIPISKKKQNNVLKRVPGVRIY